MLDTLRLLALMTNRSWSGRRNGRQALQFWPLSSSQRPRAGFHLTIRPTFGMPSDGSVSKGLRVTPGGRGGYGGGGTGDPDGLRQVIGFRPRAVSRLGSSPMLFPKMMLAL